MFEASHRLEPYIQEEEEEEEKTNIAVCTIWRCETNFYTSRVSLLLLPEYFVLFL